MSTKFYVKDENGSVMSYDGKTKYEVYEGSKAYKYLKTKDGRNKVFYSNIEPNGDKIFIECTKEQYKGFEEERKHHLYLKNQEDEKGFEKITLNFIVHLSDDEEELLEMIPDANVNIEESIETRKLLDNLSKALNSLSEDDFELIDCLFLQETPLTERMYAEKKGVHHMTIHNRKVSILKKLKKFL